MIEEAVRYIDHLHSVFLDRIKTKGLPKCFHGKLQLKLQILITIPSLILVNQVQNLIAK